MKRFIAILVILSVSLGLIGYPSSVNADNNRRDYIIILGTESIKSSVGLKQFVDYKSQMFDVTMITMADIEQKFPLVSDKVERMRQYLDTTFGVQPVVPYVLLIGTTDEIPMTTFDNRAYSQEPYFNKYQTDAILEFDKLLSDFDSNGDGWLDDHSTIPKTVYIIGRIPSDSLSFLNAYFPALISQEDYYNNNPLIHGTVACPVITLPYSGLDGYNSDKIGELIKGNASSWTWTTLYEHEGNFISKFPSLPLDRESFMTAWDSSDIVYTDGHDGCVRVIWNDLNKNDVVDNGETEMKVFYSTLSTFAQSLYLGVFSGCFTIDYNNILGNRDNLDLVNSGQLLNFVGYAGVTHTETIPKSPVIFQNISNGYSIGDAISLARTAETEPQDYYYDDYYEIAIIGDPSARINGLMPVPVTDIKVTNNNSAITWSDASPTFGYNIQIVDSNGKTVIDDLVSSSAASHTMPSLPYGNYTCKIKAIYDTGSSSWVEKSFGVIPLLVLKVDSVADHATVSQPSITISGTTNGTKVTVNSQSLAIDRGAFSTSISLQSGNNIIIVTAEDAYGQKMTQQFIVEYIPPLVITLVINSPRMRVGDSAVILDSPPIIKNSRTLVPLRAIAEAVGGAVNWNSLSREVTIESHGIVLTLTIGKNEASFNGLNITIDTNPKVVPVIINSRTMLPLRFIAECLGFQVGWEQSTQTVVLTYKSGS